MIGKVIVLDLDEQVTRKSDNRSGMILKRNIQILTEMCMKA